MAQAEVDSNEQKAWDLGFRKTSIALSVVSWFLSSCWRLFLSHGLTLFMVCSWIAPLNMGGGALLREHCLSGCRRQLTDSRVCEREREREEKGFRV